MGVSSEGWGGAPHRADVAGALLKLVTVEGPLGVVMVHAGPYREVDASRMGVMRILLASELERLPHHMMVPARDFGLPDKAAMKKAIRAAIHESIRGKTVAVGCMGGIGRTGVFLGCLHRTLNPFADSVAAIRKLYLSHAIETKNQERFVNSYRDWYGFAMSIRTIIP